MLRATSGYRFLHLPKDTGSHIRGSERRKGSFRQVDFPTRNCVRAKRKSIGELVRVSNVLESVAVTKIEEILSVIQRDVEAALGN